MNTAEQRFWKKVEKSGGCWNWTGTHLNFGYGVFKVGGKWKAAHRFSYELHFGAIATDLCVLHSCDNPQCVNPAHLRTGTRAANNAERAERGRSISGRNSLSLTERFNKQVERTDSCWIWRGSQGSSGYGVIHAHGRLKAAHRVSYELHVGEIPKGMCILHSCDDPRCVNPDHLSLGTRADNCRDKVNKGRHAHGETHGNAALTDAQVVELRRLYTEEHISYDELATHFGIARRTVEPILRGVVYQDATKGVNVQVEYGSEEWKQRISAAEKGKSFTPEHLANLRAAHAARRGTARSVPWNKGTPMSKETRLKVSAARKGKGGGRALDPAAEAERARKISEGRKRWWAAQAAKKSDPAAISS